MLTGTVSCQIPSLLENVNVESAIKLLRIYGPMIHVQFFYDLEELKADYEIESYFWQSYGLQNPGDFEDVLDQLDTLRLLGADMIEVFG